MRSIAIGAFGYYACSAVQCVCVIRVSLNPKRARGTSIRWLQTSDGSKLDVPTFATEERFEQFDRLPMQMPSEERKMRLTSRDEGGGRGGGGKEEKGGVDELHFYLGLGMSWNINCLDCGSEGGCAQKHSEEQKSCVISPGSPRGGGAVAPSAEEKQHVSRPFCTGAIQKREKGEHKPKKVE